MDIIQSIEGLSRTKLWRKGGFSISAWAGTSIFFCPWRSDILLLRPSASDCELLHQLPWFSGLQAWTELYHKFSWLSNLQTSILWRISAFIIAGADSYNETPLLYSYILFVLCLWRTLTSTDCYKG